VDEFMLKVGSQHDMRKRERLIFNFEKEGLKKIKWLSYRGLWEEDIDDEYENLLGKMFGFMNVDKLVVWIVASIIEKEEEMKNNSHWGRALWAVKERDYHQRYFEFLFMENTPTSQDDASAQGAVELGLAGGRGVQLLV
jgi:hypothetical protein